MTPAIRPTSSIFELPEFLNLDFADGQFPQWNEDSQSFVPADVSIGGGDGSPGGTSGDLQFNNGGAFGGSLLKQSANVIEQRNGTNGQNHRVYGTYIDAANYIRVVSLAGDNFGAMQLQAAGSANGEIAFYISNASSSGPLIFQTQGNERWQISAPGHLLPNGAQNLGSASKPVNNGYFSGFLQSAVYKDTDGNQVVGSRQPFIADPSGGATIDTQARSAIAAINALLQAHGLEAAS